MQDAMGGGLPTSRSDGMQLLNPVTAPPKDKGRQKDDGSLLSPDGMGHAQGSLGDGKRVLLEAAILASFHLGPAGGRRQEGGGREGGRGRGHTHSTENENTTWDHFDSYTGGEGIWCPVNLAVGNLVEARNKE